MKNSLLTISLAVFCLVCIPAATANPSIEYSLTRIDGNTWQYDYYMSGFTFTQNQAITIYFDWEHCSDLNIWQESNLLRTLQEPNSQEPKLTELDDYYGWHIVVLPPDPDLWAGENGSYNAVALVDDPPYTGPFSVQFAWLNSTDAPGAQSYDLFDANWNVIGSGVSILQDETKVPAVPEPASGFLLLGGLGLLVSAARLRQRK